MESQSANTIKSGIEPVDELMGGLDRGELYLVHGDASGKSLFGISFLVEGLKQGENCALVIRDSPEDAVRRFARLGYDCLEDVYSGRLVILEYSDDIVQKIGKLRQITPVLRELEWLLGETHPERLIFDPVTTVLAGAEGNLESPAREFADWARSFGATVVLIARDANTEIIRCFTPLVSESFRFDVREAGERASRFIAFEKSADIADQAIEVDPSRGLFLLGRLYLQEAEDAHRTAPQPPSDAELASIREELRSAQSQIEKEEAVGLDDIDLTVELIGQTDRHPEPEVTAKPAPAPKRETVDTLQTMRLSPLEERDFQTPREGVSTASPESISTEELDLEFKDLPVSLEVEAEPLFDGNLDELSDLIDELGSSPSPLELELPELASESNTYAPIIDPPIAAATDLDQPALTPAAQDISETATPKPDIPKASSKHGRAADFRIDSAMKARAVELLLSPPDADADFSLPEKQPVHPQPAHTATPAPLGDAEVRAKDFNVLLIEDDSETHELLTQTLGEYTLKVSNDGVSGLANVISFSPDLVVLDFDLPIIDGFKVLALIRSALNVPIIVLSGSHIRAIDRVMASELGADYYLTKPFSAKELKHKARQLIARYRGINTWITHPSSRAESASARGSEQRGDGEAAEELFIPYAEFESEVEKRVKSAMDNGTHFSIVGCRLSQMTAQGGRIALRLLEIVRGLVRDSDVTTTNPRNDLVILLPDAENAGACAFAGRLLERITKELHQEPSLWIRSFPDLEESTEAARPKSDALRNDTLTRRSGDSRFPGQGESLHVSALR